MCINISGNVSIPSLRQPSIPGVLCVRCPYLGGEGTSVVAYYMVGHIECVLITGV